MRMKGFGLISMILAPPQFQTVWADLRIYCIVVGLFPVATFPSSRHIFPIIDTSMLIGSMLVAHI